ncbi:hypothetical protein BS78_01G486300 [Paspalum vaginatum]|nr:hypothetical protein BS78_01G486300 [Paspalum vaginatum]KAJ1298860.1 hypothetical protein BS78_01G486300 [Paspalum vaginatum]KAJ1298861.1 hypothetical protein BS78_01G486300 [Paspalum vaginatum]KAJ1298862.1 hypothetical protein BS78_01G486300 [Paspalum vaginatum]KAJ1298863.1 hypothetical protein BS78_01G486300 [Paspalum vaginatum]
MEGGPPPSPAASRSRAPAEPRLRTPHADARSRSTAAAPPRLQAPTRPRWIHPGSITAPPRALRLGPPTSPPSPSPSRPDPRDGRSPPPRVPPPAPAPCNPRPPRRRRRCGSAAYARSRCAAASDARTEARSARARLLSPRHPPPRPQSRRVPLPPPPSRGGSASRGRRRPAIRRAAAQPTRPAPLPSRGHPASRGRGGHRPHAPFFSRRRTHPVAAPGAPDLTVSDLPPLRPQAPATDRPRLGPLPCLSGHGKRHRQWRTSFLHAASLPPISFFRQQAQECI